jgi:predicted nucleic acid-binding protein
MGSKRQAAKLAIEILRAMETGSRTRLRRKLDRAEKILDEPRRLSPYDAEQAEVLSAIAQQLKTTGYLPAPHARILEHFAGTVRVSLS